MPETVFQVDQREGDLIVTSGDFCAVVYFKPAGHPQLILRRRMPTEDHETASSSLAGSRRKGTRARVDSVTDLKKRSIQG
jgi:hypothetical protein